MNITLLKLAQRHPSGVRQWAVPGYDHPIKLVPSRHSYRGWGPSAHWPHKDGVRGVDLDRHLSVAKNEIRAMLETV